MAAMYVAGLLTDWYAPPCFARTRLKSRAIISTTPLAHPTEPLPIGMMVSDEMDVYIGRSETTMWMRVISSWLCYVLYAWSLYVDFAWSKGYLLINLGWLLSFCLIGLETLRSMNQRVDWQGGSVKAHCEKEACMLSKTPTSLLTSSLIQYYHADGLSADKALLTFVFRVSRSYLNPTTYPLT